MFIHQSMTISTRLCYLLSKEISRSSSGRDHRKVPWSSFGEGRNCLLWETRKVPRYIYNGRKVVKKSEVSGIVAKTFKETKLAGYKKVKQRSHDSCAGLTERKIRKFTSSNIRYRVHNAAFSNKAVPKPVRARHVQWQH